MNFHLRINSFEKKIATYFFLTLLIIIAIFYIFKNINKSFIETNNNVDKTNRTLLLTQEVLSRSQDIVIGARGFIITGDEVFLEPYNQALSTIDKSLSDLRKLTNENPRQKVRIDNLEQTIRRNIIIRQEMIRLRREKDFQINQIQPFIYTAREFMYNLRSIITAIQIEEESLLEQRRNLNKENIKKSYLSLIFFLIIIIFFLLIVFIIIYNNTRKRNAAEEKLIKSERFVNAVLDNTIAPIVIKNLDGKFLKVNKEFSNLVQQDQETLEGKSYHDVFPHAIAEDLHKDHFTIIKSKNKIEKEIEIPTNGGTRIFYLQDFPLTDNQEKVYAVCSFATDITTIKTAHKELHKAYTQLEKVLNGVQRIMATSMEVICLTDKEGKFIKISESCKNLFGYEAHELIGRNFIDFVAEKDKSKTVAASNEILSGLSVSNFQNHYRKQDGSFIPVIWTSAWSQEDETVYSIARDGTEKVKTAEQLAQSQERLLKAQQIARLGNWEWDVKNNIISCSNEIFNLIGIQKPFNNETSVLLNKVHPEDKPAVQNAYKAALEAGLPIDIEHRVIRSDQQVLYVHTKGEVKTDENLEPFWISGTMQDITQRKKYELELHQLNNNLEKRAIELRASNLELERFAYVASHDLQEPLRMVSSFLTLLQKKLHGTLDDTTKQYIYFAVDGAERMKRLIQDLLQYSRLGSANEEMSFVNLNEIVSNVLKIYSQSVKENEAHLEVDILPVVSGNKTQLQQLFQNLIGNALKYRSETPPEIKIGCKEENDKWVFYIKDNGIGIDPKFFDKIFILFQRLHNKSEYSGTGIGLAICKKIIEKHEGQIWLESSDGKGSTFYFTLKKQLHA